MGTQRKLLSIFISQTDRWHDSNLSEAIVFALEKHGLAGITVIEGTMGFGIHRRVHRKGLFGVSDEKPVVILAVDEEARLRSALPILKDMVKEGLITLQDVEVVFQSQPRSSAGAATEGELRSGTV